MTHSAKMETAGWNANGPGKRKSAAFLAEAKAEDPRLRAGAGERFFDSDGPGSGRFQAFLSRFTDTASDTP